jgi:hypothetical protein
MKTTPEEDLVVLETLSTYSCLNFAENVFLPA